MKPYTPIIAVMTLGAASALIGKGTEKSTPTSHYTSNITKVGTFQGPGFNVRIKGYHRTWRGSIGGNPRPRSIQMGSYGGLIYVTAAKGYLIAAQSRVLFNSRLYPVKKAKADEGEPTTRFFTKARAVRITRVNPTNEHFRMPVEFRMVLKHVKSGQLHERRLRLMITRGKTRHLLSLTEVKRKQR